MDKAHQIYKVLSGEASLAEREDLEHWIDSNPLNQEEFRNVKLLWENSRTPLEGAREFNVGLRKLRRKINVRRTRTFFERTMRIVFIGITILLFIVAIYLVMVGKKDRDPIALQFNGIELRQVVVNMEQSYGITIQVSPNIAKCRFFGSFYNESPEKAMDAISYKLGLTVRKMGEKSYFISGENCR